MEVTSENWHLAVYDLKVALNHIIDICLGNVAKEFSPEEKLSIIVSDSRDALERAGEDPDA